MQGAQPSVFGCIGSPSGVFQGQNGAYGSFLLVPLGSRDQSPIQIQCLGGGFTIERGHGLSAGCGSLARFNYNLQYSRVSCNAILITFTLHTTSHGLCAGRRSTLTTTGSPSMCGRPNGGRGGGIYDYIRILYIFVYMTYIYDYIQHLEHYY